MFLKDGEDLCFWPEKITKRASDILQAPFSADLGSPPSTTSDVPVTAVFLGLYFVCLLANLIIYLRNRKNGHHFIFSLLLSVFCLFRLISTSIRLAWAYNQNRSGLGIAEDAFLNAGIIVLYIINLFFAQRIMRARQPWLGWSASFTALIYSLMVITTLSMIMLVVVVSQSFLSSNASTLRIDRDISFYVLTLFVFVALFPILIILTALFMPKSAYIDKFGTGRFRIQLALLTTTSLILTLSAGWRCGTTFAFSSLFPTSRPWYMSSACFYIFIYALEILVLAIYLLTRIDLRFHIPSGSSFPGSYSGPPEDFKASNERSWPEAVFLPVTELRQGANGTYLPTQNTLQVDPRTGQYQLTNPDRSRMDDRGSVGSSLESRRGRWSRTSWESRSRRSMWSLQSTRQTPRRSRAASIVSPVGTPAGEQAPRMQIRRESAVTQTQTQTASSAVTTPRRSRNTSVATPIQTPGVERPQDSAGARTPPTGPSMSISTSAPPTPSLSTPASSGQGQGH